MLQSILPPLLLLLMHPHHAAHAADIRPSAEPAWAIRAAANLVRYRDHLDAQG